MQSKTIFFLVNNTTLLSDNPSCFRQNLSERIYDKSWEFIKRLEIKNYNMILTEKLQKYHYHKAKLINMNLAGKEILSSGPSQMIDQAKFTYSPIKHLKQLNTKEKSKVKL